MLVGASVSGSLDPFKPFHRRFTRLHNAATLIKINYTLARQFALLSLSLSLALALPLSLPDPHPLVLILRILSPRSLFLSLPPSPLSRPLPSHPLFSPLAFFRSHPVAFLYRTFDHHPVTPLPPSLSLLLVYLHFIRDLIYRPPATASLVRARLCDGIKKAGRG